MIVSRVFSGLVLAGLLLAGTAQPASALFNLVRSETADQKSQSNNTPAAPSENANPSSNQQGNNGTANGNGLVNGLEVDRALDLEQRKLEIQRRIEERRAAVTEKLTGEKVEACERREFGINRSIDARNAAAERYLKKFETIQDRLMTFVKEKQLAINNAGALELVMEDRHHDAAATIATAKIFDFECANTSAVAPGEVIRSVIEEERFRLAEYRDAIKDYAAAIKTTASAMSEESTDE